MLRLARLAFAALLLVFVAPAAYPVSAAPASFYTVVELPTLGGQFTYPTDINDAGQIVGLSQLPNGIYRAFRYDDGAMTDLGTLGGAASRANRINNAGDIIGSADTPSGNSQFLFRAGTMRDLGATMNFPWPAPPILKAINDAGVILGSYSVDDVSGQSRSRSFVYNGNAVTPLPIGPTDPNDRSCQGFNAQDISNAGQIVGFLSGGCGRVASPATTYLYEAGRITDLSALGIRGVTAINDSGQLLGLDMGQPILYSYSASDGTTATPLGTLSGYDPPTARGLNNAGQVVGTVAADVAAPHDRHAVIFRDGALRDLNDLLLPGSGWVLREGWAINNRGQIVGMGWRDGRERPVLVSPGFRDVPEDNPYRDAINDLASRGIIRGYEDGRFGPADPVLRAQSAALIARSAGWEAEDWGDVVFPDRGAVDADLWRNVRTLAHYRVALGYADGTYNPTGEVLHQQVLLFIARAMVQKGSWQPQPDTNPYPNLPGATERERADRRDIATYVHYAGAVPGRPIGQAWADWDQPASRGWYAQVLWQALNSIPMP